MRKIVMIILIFFNSFLVVSCSKISTESVNELKEDIIKIVKNDYNQKWESDDLFFVGQYGDGYLFSKNVNSIIPEIEKQILKIGNVEVVHLNNMMLFFYYDNHFYTLEGAYSKGMLLSKDLEHINKVLEDQELHIQKDVLENFSSSSKRCVHSFDDWKITRESTCNRKGKKKLICNKCRKNIRILEMPKTSHNYSGNTCANCGDTKWKYFYSDSIKAEEVSKKILNYKILDDFGGYQLEGKPICYIYYISRYINTDPLEDKSEIIDGISFRYLYNTDVIAFIDGQVYSLTEAYNKEYINRDILIDIQDRYIEVNICDKTYVERYEEIISPLHDYSFYLEYNANMQKRYKIVEVLLEEYWYKKYPLTNYFIDYIAYLGEFGEASVVYFSISENRFNVFLEDGICETIGEYNFKYDKSSLLLVIYNKKIYTLTEACNLNILNERNIIKIKEIFDKI